MDDDAELLRRYAENGSEADFAELVRRHINFVYGAALRQLHGDAHLAQDVTQSVFTDLARKAGTVANHRVLAGWLFTSTRFAAAKFVRSEQRRQLREREAQAMQDMLQADVTAQLDWTRVRPILDEALNELPEDDREAILLRYFEGRNFADVGKVLALTANAARMRVDRAMDRLRELLERRGVVSTAGALAAALANQSSVAAPAGLAAAIAGAAFAGGGVLAGTGGAAAAFGAAKLQAGLAAAAVFVGGAGYFNAAKARAEAVREAAMLNSQLQQVIALRAENQKLAATQEEAELLRRDDAEFARLQEQATALRLRIQKAEASRAATAFATRDQLPTPRAQPAAIYPAAMKAAGVAGTVNVDFLIDQYGKVLQPIPSKSTSREFEAAAVEAVKQWDFSAGMKNGRPISVRMTVPIVFDPQKGEGVPGDVVKPVESAPPAWF